MCSALPPSAQPDLPCRHPCALAQGSFVVGLGPVRQYSSGHPHGHLDGYSGSSSILLPETLERYERRQLLRGAGTSSARSRTCPRGTKDSGDIESPPLSPGGGRRRSQTAMGRRLPDRISLMRDVLPTEEEYRREDIDALNRQPIIFRTFDLGGDEGTAPFSVHLQEANPFLAIAGYAFTASARRSFAGSRQRRSCALPCAAGCASSSR